VGIIHLFGSLGNPEPRSADNGICPRLFFVRIQKISGQSMEQYPTEPP
jgi:hypothetical protein